MTVNIIDAPMGTGKTSAAINLMNELIKKGEHILYITPYKVEFDRIMKQCPSFVTPKKRYTKTMDIQRLMTEGQNIVSTHALFFRFNDAIIELAHANNYTLVMDETANILKLPEKMKQSDSIDIMTNHAKKDDDDIAIWYDESYDGYGFREHVEKFKNGSMMVFQSSPDVKPIIIEVFPFKVFDAFKSIYMLSYLFNYSLQKYYYDLNGCEYNHLYVEYKNGEYHITDVPQYYDTSHYKDLINICDSEKLNAIGDTTYSLSTGWYKKNLNTSLMKIMKNNIYNYFHNIVKSPSDLNMWTVVRGIEKDEDEDKQVPRVKNKLKGKGYTNGFVPRNMRATNEYRHKTCLAYLSNVYMNPAIRNYLMYKGVDVNEDMYALSEMIQWIWRSAIRDDKPINIYIPSKRMRDLLIKWLNDELDLKPKNDPKPDILPDGDQSLNKPQLLSEEQIQDLIHGICQ